jgi:hypothetical protein
MTAAVSCALTRAATRACHRQLWRLPLNRAYFFFAVVLRLLLAVLLLVLDLELDALFFDPVPLDLVGMLTLPSGALNR